MRKEGQITVFLSLTLICMCALLLGILESARTAGARCYLRIAADSALDSLFSQYHRQLWDQYRILALEYEDQEDIEKRFETWLTPYLEEDNCYPMQINGIQTRQIDPLTGDSGASFEKEILQYMKYGIWHADITEESAADIYSRIKESGAMSGLSDRYMGHTREAFRLEEALEAIASCLNEQEQLYRLAEEELYAEDGPAFRREAKRLISELKRIPGLVKEYEKKADSLGKALAQSREAFLADQEDLSEDMRSAMEQEIAGYEEYTDQDGERRKEITALIPAAAANEILVKETIEEALRVEEVIEEWEDSEDEDGEGELDTAALWIPVREHFRGFAHKSLSFKPGVKDKEKQRILEQVRKMIDVDLLSLVLPEGSQVSKGVLDLSQAPSAAEYREQNGEGPMGEQLTGRVKGLLSDEYCVQFFSDFLTPGIREVQYETEYLIGEQKTDEENLKAVVLELLGIRAGLNLMWLLSNPEKRQEAEAMAAIIAGAVGAGPLTGIVSFFILSVWALGEAVCDIRTLLHGWKVPLLKSEASWKLSLEGLLQMGRDGSAGAGNSQDEGMHYASYLKLLLFMKDPREKLYRMMDVIQMNIRREQPDFLMNHCAYAVDIGIDNRGKHVFFSMGLWKSMMGGTEAGYAMPVTVQKAY